VLGRELLYRALTHRLRERVVVGPAERLRSRPPVLHEPLGHPALASLFRVVGDRLRAGAAVLDAGLAQERVEQLGLAARRLDVGASAERELGLHAPVDAVVERRLGDHALAVPRDVRGRDVHEMRSRVH
jgi:hypothetical protein